MKPFICLVLALALAGSVFAQASDEAALPEPSGVEVSDAPSGAEQTKAFDRNGLMTYPKSVLVNLCLSLQSRVAELEERTRGTVDVLALQDRIAELEAENELLKRREAASRNSVPEWPALSDAAGNAPAGSTETKPEGAFNPRGFSYKYVIQYRSHYEFGGVYESGPRSARHLRDRIKVLLRVTNTNASAAHIKYYVEACSNRDGGKVLARSGQFSATLKPGALHEPTAELLGDNLAIATDLIRLADVEIVEAGSN